MLMQCKISLNWNAIEDKTQYKESFISMVSGNQLELVYLPKSMVLIAFFFVQDWFQSFELFPSQPSFHSIVYLNLFIVFWADQVPAAVSHGEFWSRYFYKVHLLDQDEARRNALKERAEMTSSQHLEEDLGWGDEGNFQQLILFCLINWCIYTLRMFHFSGE